MRTATFLGLFLIAKALKHDWNEYVVIVITIFLIAFLLADITEFIDKQK